MRIGKIVYFTIALLVLLTSCDNGYNCSINNTAYNRIGFYSISGDSIRNGYLLPEELEVSLMVNGREAMVADQGNEDLRLPMSYTSDCDTLLFRYDSDMSDTIYFRHKNIQFYQSMECGTVMYHRIDSVEYTHNLIDSVAIVNKFVNFDDNENIKVYFIE